MARRKLSRTRSRNKITTPRKQRVRPPFDPHPPPFFSRIAVTPTNLQKIEFDITTAEGPSRMTIVSGILPVPGVPAQSGSAGFESRDFSVSALVDPTLTPGQFRRATATAALAGLDTGVSASQSFARYSIKNVEASLDDESGRIEIRVDGEEGVSNGSAAVTGLTFQVTTLALAKL
jgi:hypothetical protein